MDLTKRMVSEHYWWIEATGEFWDSRTAELVSDKLYNAKVSVFEDRERAWFLDVAQSLTVRGPSPADYVALSIAVAYIEGIEQYRQGKTSQGRSREWFKASANRIFTDAEEAVERLWIGVRNGLFHTGFTIGQTYVDYNLSLPLESSVHGLGIHPRRFVDAIVGDFRKYVQELRLGQTEELGKLFEKLWDERWETS